MQFIRHITDQVSEAFRQDPIDHTAQMAYEDDERIVALGALDNFDRLNDETPDAYFQQMIKRGVTPASMQWALDNAQLKSFSDFYGLGYDDIYLLKERWGLVSPNMKARKANWKARKDEIIESIEAALAF